MNIVDGEKDVLHGRLQKFINLVDVALQDINDLDVAVGNAVEK